MHYLRWFIYLTAQCEIASEKEYSSNLESTINSLVNDWYLASREQYFSLILITCYPNDSLINQCVKLQCNIMLISVFKMVLKIWSKLYLFTCCVSYIFIIHKVSMLIMISSQPVAQHGHISSPRSIHPGTSHAKPHRDSKRNSIKCPRSPTNIGRQSEAVSMCGVKTSSLYRAKVTGDVHQLRFSA
jgi:hypothetical protein